MTQKKRIKLKPWLIVYAAMVVAVFFATQPGAVAPLADGALSPVVINGEAPLLKVNSVARRADL